MALKKPKFPIFQEKLEPMTLDGASARWLSNYHGTSFICLLFLLGPYGTLEFVNDKATQRVEEDLEGPRSLLRFSSHCCNPTHDSASLAIEYIGILVI